MSIETTRRTHQQQKAYFAWLDMIAKELNKAGVNLDDFIVHLSNNGYEMPVTLEFVECLIDSVTKTAFNTPYSMLCKDDRVSIIVAVKTLLSKMGLDVSNIGSIAQRGRFAVIVKNVASEQGFTVNKLMQSERKKVRLGRLKVSKDYLHYCFVKSLLLNDLFVDKRSTSELNTVEFNTLKQAIDMSCAVVGVTVPDFPDLHTPPICAYQ